MPIRDPIPRKELAWEDPGTVDGPFDVDRRSSTAEARSDAACTIPWVVEGFDAIQIFVDPALVERAPELCSAAVSWSDASRDIESLTRGVMEYAAREGLSASIYEDPPDDPSRGVVAIAFTIG